MGGATRFLMLLTSTTTPLLHHRYPSLLRTLAASSISCLSHRYYHHRLPSSISPSLPRRSKIKASQQLHSQTASNSTTSSFSSHLVSQTWPEWSNFTNNLSAGGYFNSQRFVIDLNEEFVAGLNLPEHFLVDSSACLAFAFDRPDLLGLLSRRDIEIVVEKGMPFLFRNGDDSVRRMRSFLGSAYCNNTDRAHTIDLVRFLLSYASNYVPSEKNFSSDVQLVESSVRNLLNELAQLSIAPETNVSGSFQNQYSDRYAQTSRSPGAPEMNISGSVLNPDRYVPAPRPNEQNIEMKRGDWVCPRCTFMNFARNMKCLECQEARPKRQLTGGEWECPQCDFFNYGRNTVCLRCDCRRPGEVSIGTNNSLGYDQGSNAGKAPVDGRLAANEEKAQRWFNKISQLDSNSDMSSAIADEDFPEIMPLRKGVNRFVVSTRKTPLERRLANSQYQSNLGDATQSSSSNLNPNHSFDPNLQNAGTNTASPASNSGTPPGAPRGSNYVPFVPLPADMFAKKPDQSNINEDGKVETNINMSRASVPGEQRDAVSGSNEYSKSSSNLQSFEAPNQNQGNRKEEEQAEKSERWFKRVAELHNVTDLPSAIPDEDFPEIMPMRKGENKFVVSKRKDRSLTSPVYKRRVAMEQANDTNFVPFVPFPPNYFSQKDNQQRPGADSTNNSSSGTSNSASSEELRHVNASKSGVSNADHAPRTGNQNYNPGSVGSRTWEENRSTEGASLTGEYSSRNVIDPQPSSRDSWRNGDSSRDSTPNMVGNSHQNITETPRNITDSRRNGFSTKEEIDGAASFSGTTSENQNFRGSWSGKSLEGSAVKEPDP